MRRPMMDKMLRLAEVMERTGLSRTTIWRYEREGSFPRRRKIGKTMVGWLASEIETWLNSRPKG